MRVVRGTGEGQDEGRSSAVSGELQPPAPPAPLPPPGADAAGAADDHLGDDSSLPTVEETFISTDRHINSPSLHLSTCTV